MKRLSQITRELIIFAKKQAYAALFGGFLLIVMIGTSYISIPGIHRYDLIFLLAIFAQIVLYVSRLETKYELLMIAVFHVVATAMELFKTQTSIGSWSYPELSVFHIATVPLFAGFLYSAVGSYIARVWRIFKFSFTNYPKPWFTYVLAVLIYANFFLHHFILDVRIGLFVLTLIIYGQTWIHFTVVKTRRKMPLVVGFFLVAFFIWVAENIGTFTQVWLYPTQTDTWHLVPLGKLGSWFLLMIISFVLISLLHHKTLGSKRFSSDHKPLQP